MAPTRRSFQNNDQKGKKSIRSSSVATKGPTEVSTSHRTKRKADDIEDQARQLEDPTTKKRIKPNALQTPPSSQATRNVVAVFGFGSHEMGELGLGSKATEVKRPRLISSLDPDSETAFHVTQLDCGGMHTLALTADNRIISWGVNDNGALGRNTDWDGGLRDVDDDESDGDELNPLESTPTEIPASNFPPKTKFVHVAAGDSCSFAVTDEGFVYGWGTFVNSKGDKCFGYNDDDRNTTTNIQSFPVLVPGLKDVTQITCGANHAVALDKHGSVWAWGVDEQNQLGRAERSNFGRYRKDSLVPHRVGVCPRGARYIASGPYHSFAIDARGVVWSWGLNSFGQADSKLLADDDGPNILPHPMRAANLRGKRVTTVCGGAHHSVAITNTGDFLVWGRLDAGQLGVTFTEDQLNDPTLIRRDESGHPRICLRPTLVPDIGRAAYASCGIENTIFVNTEGTAFSAGFGSQGQLGLGEIESQDKAQEIISKAIAGRRVTWAGTGGQFSMIASSVA